MAVLLPDAGARARLLGDLEHAAGPGGAVRVGRSDLLFPRLTAAGNIEFALRTRLRDRTLREQRLAALLAMAGLEPAAGTSAGTLDRTGRAATLLARGLAAGHRHLLLDDLLGGLDEAPRATLHATLRRMAAAGDRTGILLATASRDDVLNVGDRIGVDGPGGIRRLAPLPELFARPDSATEAALVGGSNILTGRIIAVDPDDDREAEVRLACGGVVPATRHAEAALDALCLLAVRPDHVAFAALPAAELGPGALPATLLDHRHGGDRISLRLRLADGTTLTVRRPAGSVTPRDIARAGLPDGASVAWRPGDATAFPHPDA